MIRTFQRPYRKKRPRPHLPDLSKCLVIELKTKHFKSKVIYYSGLVHNKKGCHTLTTGVMTVVKTEDGPFRRTSKRRLFCCLILDWDPSSFDLYLKENT